MKFQFGFALLVAALLGAPAAVAAPQPADGFQRRPARVTIYPQNRPMHPNAKRECVAYLEKEYRVSGPVIVPRQRCRWN